MDNDALTSIQQAFLSFKLRADTVNDEILTKTFVDSPPIVSLLAVDNHQVLYGRRGTGKTHALKYISEVISSDVVKCMYFDLRSIGSNTSIYNDYSRPASQRASQLIADVLQAMLDYFYPLAVEGLNTSLHPAVITENLDNFQAAMTTVQIKGEVERELTGADSASSKEEAKLAFAASKTPTANFATNQEHTTNTSTSTRYKASGAEVLHLDFGNVRSALENLIAVLGIEKLWVVVDEWVEVPSDIQPFLADLFRRMVLPIKNCVLKIAAIEHRSNFILRREIGSYIGLELGADVSANLNLDDFLVFDSNEQRSISFFKELLFKHYKNSKYYNDNIKNGDDLIHAAFTQNNVFSEFVKAVEGVPRDALNLAATITTKSYGQRIAMKAVRDGASDWYQRDKEAPVRASEELAYALSAIKTEIVTKRKVMAFMFPSLSLNKSIDDLFDARLLHVLKRNVSAKDEPGIRYDVLKVDYGCYVDLINTFAAPDCLLKEDDDEMLMTPKTDYRSIRRAILRPEQITRQTVSED